MSVPEQWVNVPDEVKCDQARIPYRENYDLTDDFEPALVEHNINVYDSQLRTFPVEIAYFNASRHFDKSNATPRGIISFSEDLQDEPPIIEHSYTRHRNSLFRESSTSLRLETPSIFHPKKFIKGTILVAVWLVCTVVFIAFMESGNKFKYASIEKDQTKSYNVGDTSKSGKFSVILIIKGPFLSQVNQLASNNSELGVLDIVVDVLYKGNTSKKAEKSNHHKLNFIKSAIDTTGEQFRHVYISVPSSKDDPHSNDIEGYAVTFKNVNSNAPIPFSFICLLNNLGPAIAMVVSSVMALILILLVSSEVIDRTLAAVLMATFSIALMSMVGVRPTTWRLAAWMRPSTLLLAFSIMIMTSIAAESGMFEVISICVFKVARNNFFHVMHILWISTAVFSACTNNLAAILFMTPIGIRVSEIMQMDPVPILMTMAMFSNIGGAATPVSSLPNVIINFRPAVERTGASNIFKFLGHMIFGIILVCVQTYVYFRVLFIRTKRFELFATRTAVITHQYILWRRLLDAIPPICADWNYIKEHLRVNVPSSPTLTMRISTVPALPSVHDLNIKVKIKDKSLFIKSAITFIFTLVTLAVPFFIQHLYMGWTAIMPALLLLVLIDKELEPILHRVEWSTLVFLASIFLFAQSMDRLHNFSEGYMESLLQDLTKSDTESHRVLKLLSIIVWVFGIMSSFVNNATLTEMITPGVVMASLHCNCYLQLGRLLNALSFAVCLGGNGTLMGSVSNIICAGVSEQQGYHITYLRFLKFGMPVMLGNLFVAYFYLLFLLEVGV